MGSLLAALPLLPAAATEVIPGRYLLFDVIPHEQLNKQRRALMFFLDLALKLKRTLVLPRARILRRTDTRGGFDPNPEFVRMGELLNLSALRQLHPVIELEDYLAEHGEVEQGIRQHSTCTFLLPAIK